MMLASKGLFTGGETTGSQSAVPTRREGKTSTHKMSRVVALAIDASEHSEYAFDCEYIWHPFVYKLHVFLLLNPMIRLLNRCDQSCVIDTIKQQMMRTDVQVREGGLLFISLVCFRQINIVRMLVCWLGIPGNPGEVDMLKPWIGGVSWWTCKLQRLGVPAMYTADWGVLYTLSVLYTPRMLHPSY